jgi:hypothetical protein
MGFEAMFFGRQDGKEDLLRLQQRKDEWIHYPMLESFGSDYKLLFHKLKNSYVSPYGFDFDILNNDPIWENDKTMTSYNAEEEARRLVDFLEDYSSCYATDDVLLLFGMDFNYMNAFQNYENMERMMAYMNENFKGKYHFKYSTPGNYIDAINAKNHTWPTKSQDLFPYGDDYESWWTGYFTSRPGAKSYVRTGSHIFHASSQLASQAMLDP